MANEDKITEKELLSQLKGKERRFAEEYLIDLNATQAAIRAGYSAESMSTLGVMAHKLTRKDKVRAYIDFMMAQHSRRTGVTTERVIRELARIAFLDPTNLVDMDTASVLEFATADDRAAISSVKVKTIPTPDGVGIEREVRFADKIKSLELLGKRLGMFTEQLKLSGGVGVTIIDDVPRTAEETQESEDYEDGDDE